MAASARRERAGRVEELPTGTVTFLFTDIEGSTQLLQALGDRYRELLSDHGRLVRDALDAHGGTEILTEGDSFFAVFRSAADAVAAAAAVQRALAAHGWPAGREVRVRMGIHTGEGRLSADGTYVGLDVHRAARMAASAHGGQVVLSDSTAVLATRSLPDGVALRDLGTHRLKDIDQPEHLLQLTIAGLPDQFPALRTADVGQANLPPTLTSFVGREQEIVEVAALLDENRLLTLIGPGGTGKTRLAMEVARRRLDRVANGVHFVALDAIHDPALVPSAVAQVLGVAERGRAAEEALLEELAGKQLLLVLDNFEQILPAAAFVDRLLTGVTGLRVLVTSRVPLQLYGEQEYEVTPLAVPDPTAEMSPETLSQYEAVALFIERARAVSPRFAVTNENAPAVAEISVRLDGLPLAIELAAARVKLLSPDAILARLGRRLELLASQSPSLPPRQRTLRGAIDWSWGLLDERERQLFERLSVFAGGWDLGAAEAVCQPAELGIDLLDGMTSLMDKSLIRRAPQLESRFMMLQTIQEYGRERLTERGEATPTAARHAAHFRGLAEAAEPELEGADPAGAVQRLILDQENLRAALAWAVETGDAETGFPTAAAIWRFWQERGQLREGRRWLEQLLALPLSEGQRILRARALTAAGGIAYWQGDGTARRYYEEALEIHRAIGDANGIADSLQNLAFATMASDLEAGMGLFRESLDRYRELGDERNIPSVVGALGYGHMMLGRFDEARTAFVEALDRNIAIGAPGRANDNRFALGHLERLAGNVQAAAAVYHASLEEVRSLGDAPRMLMQLRAIGALAAKAGRHDDAVRLAGAVERAKEEQGGTLAVPLPGVTDPVEEVRAAGEMSQADISRLLAEGRAMALPAAVEFALSMLESLSS